MTNRPINIDSTGRAFMCAGVRSVSYRHLLESKSPTDITSELVELNDYYTGNEMHDKLITQRILALNYAMKQIGDDLLEKVEKLLPEALRRGGSIYNKHQGPIRLTI